MIQRYTKKDNPRSRLGCFFTRCRFEGIVYAKFGSKADGRYACFSGHGNSYIGGYSYEQRCTYQAEEFELRRFEKSCRGTRGFMLNITGLNRFFFVRDKL